MKNADLALYKAKSAGRDCVLLFDAEMTLEADERRCLETDMRAGLVRVNSSCSISRPSTSGLTVFRASMRGCAGAIRSMA
jgi:hypothetical protein